MCPTLLRETKFGLDLLDAVFGENGICCCIGGIEVRCRYPSIQFAAQRGVLLAGVEPGDSRFLQSAGTVDQSLALGNSLGQRCAFGNFLGHRRSHLRHRSLGGRDAFVERAAPGDEILQRDRQRIRLGAQPAQLGRRWIEVGGPRSGVSDGSRRRIEGVSKLRGGGSARPVVQQIDRTTGVGDGRDRPFQLGSTLSLRDSGLVLLRFRDRRRGGSRRIRMLGRPADDTGRTGLEAGRQLCGHAVDAAFAQLEQMFPGAVARGCGTVPDAFCLDENGSGPHQFEGRLSGRLSAGAPLVQSRKLGSGRGCAGHPRFHSGEGLGKCRLFRRRAFDGSNGLGTLSALFCELGVQPVGLTGCSEQRLQPCDIGGPCSHELGNHCSLVGRIVLHRRPLQCVVEAPALCGRRQCLFRGGQRCGGRICGGGGKAQIGDGVGDGTRSSRIGQFRASRCSGGFAVPVLRELLFGDGASALQVQGAGGLGQRGGRTPGCRVDQHRTTLGESSVLPCTVQNSCRPFEGILGLLTGRGGIGGRLGYARGLGHSAQHDVDGLVGVGKTGGQFSTPLSEPFLHVAESACVEESFE